MYLSILYTFFVIFCTCIIIISVLFLFTLPVHEFIVHVSFRYSLKFNTTLNDYVEQYFTFSIAMYDNHFYRILCRQMKNTTAAIKNASAVKKAMNHSLRWSTFFLAVNTAKLCFNIQIHIKEIIQIKTVFSNLILSHRK